MTISKRLNANTRFPFEKTLLSNLSRAVLLCFVLTSCTNKAKPPSKIPVVKVNEHVLSLEEFSNQLVQKLRRYDVLAAKDPQTVKRVKDRLVDSFIISALLKSFAKNNGIEVTDEEVAQEFDRLRKSYPDDESFKESLLEGDHTVKSWKESLRTQLLEKKTFKAIKPQKEKSPGQLEAIAKDHYQKNRDTFKKPPRARIHQIVVSKEDDAERLRARIRKGASFSDLAKKYSISADAAEGGDIGYISKGSLAVFDRVFSSPINRLSPVIKSIYGFHIMKVVGKKPGGIAPFSEVKDKLIGELKAKEQQLAFNTWLKGQLKKAQVKQNQKAIDSLSVHTEGSVE